MKEYKIGQKVVDIYEFMSYFLNPHQRHRNFVYEIKSINDKYFSIYDMSKFDITAPMNENKRIKIDKDTSFEKIISTLQVTPYRQPIYLRVEEDKDVIEQCKQHLFDTKYQENEKKEKEKIARLEKEIEDIRKNGIFGSKKIMGENEERFDLLFEKTPITQ